MAAIMRRAKCVETLAAGCFSALTAATLACDVPERPRPVDAAVDSMLADAPLIFSCNLFDPLDSECTADEPYCCNNGGKDGVDYCSDELRGDPGNASCREQPNEPAVMCDYASGAGCEEGRPFCCMLDFLSITFCVDHELYASDGSWMCAAASPAPAVPVRAELRNARPGGSL